MIVKLFYRRYYVEDSREYGSVKEAVESALGDIECGEAFPIRIERDGETIWEFDGKLTGWMSSQLEALTENS